MNDGAAVLAMYGAGFLLALWGLSRAILVTPKDKATTASYRQKVFGPLDPTEDYLADRISVVSYLLRVDALFAARIKEITDWDRVDWTGYLGPCGGWKFEGDHLITDTYYSVYVYNTPGALSVAQASEALSRALGIEKGQYRSGPCTCRERGGSELSMDQYGNPIKVLHLTDCPGHPMHPSYSCGSSAHLTGDTCVNCYCWRKSPSRLAPDNLEYRKYGGLR